MGRRRRPSSPPVTPEDIEIGHAKARYVDGNITLPEFEGLVGRALQGEVGLSPSDLRNVSGYASAVVGPRPASAGVMGRPAISPAQQWIAKRLEERAPFDGMDTGPELRLVDDVQGRELGP